LRKAFGVLCDAILLQKVVMTLLNKNLTQQNEQARCWVSETFLSHNKNPIKIK